MKVHWLPVKARIEFKICLITFKALKFSQPLYIRELLSLPPVEPVMGLRSSDDPYHLCEPRAVGESNFTNRSFSYVAPRLHNKSCHFHWSKLSQWVLLRNSLNHFSFPVFTICPTIQFVKNMHYTPLFVSFELFSSAYEFQNVWKNWCSEQIEIQLLLLLLRRSLIRYQYPLNPPFFIIFQSCPNKNPAIIITIKKKSDTLSISFKSPLFIIF